MNQFNKMGVLEQMNVNLLALILKLVSIWPFRPSESKFLKFAQFLRLCSKNVKFIALTLS